LKNSPLSVRARPYRKFALVAATVAVVLTVLVSRMIASHESTTLLANPSCGRAVNVSDRVDTRPNECLWQAYSAGGTAQATVIQYTTEGDPITYSVNLGVANEIDVRIDSQDRFGPKGTFAYTCHGLSREPAPNASAHMFLFATTCTGPHDFLDGSRLLIP
jgi:hypothetical protein